MKEKQLRRYQLLARQRSLQEQRQASLERKLEEEQAHEARRAAALDLQRQERFNRTADHQVLPQLESTALPAASAVLLFPLLNAPVIL